MAYFICVQPFWASLPCQPTRQALAQAQHIKADYFLVFSVCINLLDLEGGFSSCTSLNWHIAFHIYKFMIKYEKLTFITPSLVKGGWLSNVGFGCEDWQWIEKMCQLKNVMQKGYGRWCMAGADHSVRIGGHGPPSPSPSQHFFFL